MKQIYVSYLYDSTRKIIFGLDFPLALSDPSKGKATLNKLTPYFSQQQINTLSRVNTLEMEKSYQISNSIYEVNVSTFAGKLKSIDLSSYKPFCVEVQDNLNLQDPNEPELFYLFSQVKKAFDPYHVKLRNELHEGEKYIPAKDIRTLKYRVDQANKGYYDGELIEGDKRDECLFTKIEHLEFWGFKHALRGMRNSFGSWDKSDTYNWKDMDKFEWVNIDEDPESYIGTNDKALMIRLAKAGSSHRKFLRQIFVSFDLTAPLFFWKQFDTYKVGTTANACSTMHTIMRRPLSHLDFARPENSSVDYDEDLACIIKILNKKISEQNFEEVISLLPDSFLQKRTITCSYENIINMVEQRSNHKLKEWHYFCGEMRNLPLMNDFLKD